MSIEAMKMALEALEDIFGKEKVDVGAINALRQAIEQAEDAVSAEREACAQVCENMERNGAWITKAEAAAAIRERGET